MQKPQPFDTSTSAAPPGWSFTLHEGLRILIPGFYFAALLLFFSLAALARFVPFNLPSGVMGILFLFVIMVAGLTMYARESPKRRRAFTENQPSKYLVERSRTTKSATALTDDDARKLYFYILNTYMPSAFQEKVFFFGTIYHSMVLIRRTSFWFAAVAAVTILINLADGVPLADQQGLALFALLVLLIYFLNVRHNKADRKMQENYQDQIFWLKMNDELITHLLRSYRLVPKQ
jgi:hypothetical protein